MSTHFSSSSVSHASEFSSSDFAEESTCEEQAGLSTKSSVNKKGNKKYIARNAETGSTISHPGYYTAEAELGHSAEEFDSWTVEAGEGLRGRAAAAAEAEGEAPIHQTYYGHHINHNMANQEGKREARPDDWGGMEKPKCPAFVTMGAVFLVISFIWGTYFWLHTLRLNRVTNLGGSERDFIINCTAIANVLTAFLLAHYWIAHCTKAGSIPKNYIWVEGTAHHCLETKGDGDKRYCKWCEVYKPDRAHHCRICGECVLRMDHHCPWLGNCVGFYNHKYFINTVIFGMLSAWFMFGSMIPTTMKEFDRFKAGGPDKQDALFYFVFCMIVQAVQGFVAVVLTGFLIFHLHLMCRGMTTIEFCERRRSETAVDYSNGCWGNYTAVFGENPILSCCPCPCAPCAKPKGDGTRFRGRLTGPPVVEGQCIEAGSSSEDELLYAPMQGGTI
ncbi:unnamed protein product [Amoebophrya sp. A120]|nr:unnamed protein product [Amoebophrya sp. A120]|eukprot:GSA120T00004900001.1